MYIKEKFQIGASTQIINLSGEICGSGGELLEPRVWCRKEGRKERKGRVEVRQGK